MFQMTFAIITPALIVGGFAERMRFSSMLTFSALWLLVVYARLPTGYGAAVGLERWACLISLVERWCTSQQGSQR